MNDMISTTTQTPCVLIDYEQLLANISWAQRTAKANGVALRPHIKTHKCLQIARLQLEAGAAGITASKTDEALVFINGGIRSVTVAYPIVDLHKMSRLLTAAKKHETDLRLSIDSFEGIEVAGSATKEHGYPLCVFIEIDVGLHRCGLKEADSRLIGMVERIKRHPLLKFAGLLSHAGHSYAAKDANQVQAIAEEECAILSRVRSRLEQAGFPVEEVSVGATPTFLASRSYEGITEARPGNYVFMDQTPIRLGLITPDRVALHVLSTIVSVNEDYFIIDAGSKVLSSDFGAHGAGTPGAYGMAHPVNGFQAQQSGLTVAKLSEEHGFVGRDNNGFPVGTRLRIVPNHACPVVNLAEELVVLKEGGVTVWPVDARAKVH
jgi:D-serine deaminase-like pyridoxal phosphate-dependent protein